MNINYAIFHDALSIPRLKHGVIILLGCLANAEECTKPENQRVCYRNMNHIYSKFKQLLLNTTKGYLKIDEMNVDWEHSRDLPIQIMRRDYIVHEDCRDEKSLAIDYKEYFILQQKYNNNFNIFEAVIRDSIIKERVQITEDQIHRVLNPVLSDNNRSILHHLSARRLPTLQKLFSFTKLREYVSDREKRFIFFLDFENKSPLCYALNNFDLESFKFLLQQLVEYQNTHFSSYLLDNWLLKALNLDIDLKPLFESKLCT